MEEVDEAMSEQVEMVQTVQRGTQPGEIVASDEYNPVMMWTPAKDVKP